MHFVRINTKPYSNKMIFKLLLLSVTYSLLQANNQEWSYQNINAWQRTFPLCAGRRQSPIGINPRQVQVSRDQLRLINYDQPFRGQLRMVNNGHAASIALNTTSNARVITNDGTYIAMEMHFHWPGEHVINGRRFSAEIHIVHRNQRYPTMEQALRREDGVKVVTVLLSPASRQNPHRRGLDPILNRIPNITAFNRQVTLENGLSLTRFLSSINTTRYFHYKGSLTAPPCAEAVEFFIFQETIPISSDRTQRFYQMRDSKSRVLRATNRPLQNLNNRPVFCRGC